MIIEENSARRLVISIAILIGVFACILALGWVA